MPRDRFWPSAEKTVLLRLTKTVQALVDWTVPLCHPRNDDPMAIEVEVCRESCGVGGFDAGALSVAGHVYLLLDLDPPHQLGGLVSTWNNGVSTREPRMPQAS